MNKIVIILLLAFSFEAKSQTPTQRTNQSDNTTEFYVRNSPGNTVGNSRVVLKMKDSTLFVINFEDISFPQMALRTDGVLFRKLGIDASGHLLASIDAGGGGGGVAGISQLGNGFGLIRVNDSTYRIDTTLIITKYQSEKTRDSLAALKADKATTLTINGVTQNLSANRTWTIGFDTTDIAQFSIKVRSLFAATGALTYSNGSFGLDSSYGKWRSENYYNTKFATLTQLALKLNISDTPGMLSPYLRSTIALATYATKTNLADSMITIRSLIPSIAYGSNTQIPTSNGSAFTYSAGFTNNGTTVTMPGATISNLSAGQFARVGTSGVLYTGGDQVIQDYGGQLSLENNAAYNVQVRLNTGAIPWSVVGNYPSNPYIFSAYKSRFGGTASPDEAVDVTGNIKASGLLNLANNSAPSSPSSGFGLVYLRNDSLRVKNSAGIEFTLGAATVNQTISFSPTGDVTGSTTGTTTLAPALVIGNSKVTNAMLAGSIAYGKLSLTGSILNADLAGSIDAAKINTGVVSNTEFNFLDGVTSAIQTQMDLKAPLASPGLTGVPTAPTAAAGTSTTQIATTAFVASQIPVGYTSKKRTADTTSSSTTLANLGNMFFPVTAGTTYYYKFLVIYQTGATTTGLKLALTFPAVTVQSAQCSIFGFGADGATTEPWVGTINSSGDVVTSTGVVTASVNYTAIIEGTIVPSSSGNLVLQWASEAAAACTLKQGSVAYLWAL